MTVLYNYSNVITVCILEHTVNSSLYEYVLLLYCMVYVTGLNLTYFC